MHSVKNVATSAKPGGEGVLEVRPYVRCDRCRASCVILAKWKNQIKWSATTRTQDKMKDTEEREMIGHAYEKF